jgi:hypothetical protein
MVFIRGKAAYKNHYFSNTSVSDDRWGNAAQTDFIPGRVIYANTFWDRRLACRDL